MEEVEKRSPQALLMPSNRAQMEYECQCPVLSILSGEDTLAEEASLSFA